MVVHQRAVRRGITLIEILFSIGIVVIGVFGVMALLMLAGARARQAIDASATSAAGRQALGQLAVRGWQRTDMVLIQTPAGWQPLELIAALRQSNPAGFRQIFPDGRISYCLDPLFVGHSLASSSPMTPASPESRFPYGG
ncbi:MAG TPA: type II secretion system protein, partial [Planctomycetaceae bacterium]|nr:type II secretion system protein [Planctomycetaceae bacterium]